jgi:hypothetical protein
VLDVENGVPGYKYKGPCLGLDTRLCFFGAISAMQCTHPTKVQWYVPVPGAWCASSRKGNCQDSVVILVGCRPLTQPCWGACQDPVVRIQREGPACQDPVVLVVATHASLLGSSPRPSGAHPAARLPRPTWCLSAAISTRGAVLVLVTAQERLGSIKDASGAGGVELPLSRVV